MDNTAVTRKAPLRKMGTPVEGGEPVFTTPWEARIFAIIAGMASRDQFEWGKFQSCLIEEIAKNDGMSKPASELDGTEYYHRWLAAAEALCEQEGMLSQSEISARVSDLSGKNAPGKQSPTGSDALPVAES